MNPKNACFSSQYPSETVPKKLHKYLNVDSLSSIFITFDVDWAPDALIKYCIDILDEANVTATFFATHDSPLLQEISLCSNHEIGIHPNLTPGSTQGSDTNSIITHLKTLYPAATSNRFHVLGYSYRDLSALSGHSISADVSCLNLNSSHLLPVYHEDLSLLRVPYFWEDGVAESTSNLLNLASSNIFSPGLKVLNFHPLNVFINAPNAEQRRKCQQKYPDLLRADPNQLMNERHTEAQGAATALEWLCKIVRENEIRTHKISDLTLAYPHQ